MDPSLSMTHARMAAWMKREGDFVSTGDVLCVVENDKIKVSLKATRDGVLASILAPASSVRDLSADACCSTPA